jgi:hypothetical protein
LPGRGKTKVKRTLVCEREEPVAVKRRRPARTLPPGEDPPVDDPYDDPELAGLMASMDDPYDDQDRSCYCT